LASLGVWRDARALINAFDTGVYMQVLHNVREHGDLASSLTGETNFLAHHFQPAILLLAPLAWVPRHPVVYLFVGLAAIILTVLPMMKLVAALPREAQGLGYAAVLAFCMHPSVAGCIWHGFDPDVLALPAF